MLFKAPEAPVGASDDEIATMMSEFSVLVMNSIANVQRASRSGEDLSAVDADKVRRMCAIDLDNMNVQFVRSGSNLYLKVE